MTFVLLDDGCGIIVGIETIHQDERNINVVSAVEEFDLSDREIEKRHSVTDFDNRLWANATHGCTKTSVELDYRELVQELNCIAVWERFIRNDLLRRRRSDLCPVDFVALGFVVEVSSEESEEVIHLRLKSLLFLWVADCIGKIVEGIAHLACGNVGGCIFECLPRIQNQQGPLTDAREEFHDVVNRRYLTKGTVGMTGLSMYDARKSDALQILVDSETQYLHSKTPTGHI